MNRPYGCYYYGDGHSDKTGYKCKDNRSVISKFILDGPTFTNETLNIPYPTDLEDPSVEFTNHKWTFGGEPGNKYVCPPKSRFIDKLPYDYLCSTTAKRCKSSDDNEDHNNYCEIMYMKSNYNDGECMSNFANTNIPTEIAKNAAKGPLEVPSSLEDPNGNVGDGIDCIIVDPAIDPDGYKSDNYCPFPLPAAENVFFSEEENVRDN